MTTIGFSQVDDKFIIQKVTTFGGVSYTKTLCTCGPDTLSVLLALYKKENARV